MSDESKRDDIVTRMEEENRDKINNSGKKAQRNFSRKKK